MWDTAAAALATMARALGDPRDLATLHAVSGLAFRLSVDARLTPAGPHRYPWREELTVAAERLGYRWRLAAASGSDPLFATLRDDAFAIAADGIDAGRPTLLFGVHVAEFGLVRGADRAADALVVSGLLDAAGAPDLLPRAALGDSGLLFALQLTDRLPIDPLAAARAAFAAAVEHARGESATYGGVASGLAAFAAAERALASGDVDPNGLAAVAQRLAEARAACAAFLPRAGADLGQPLDEAARSYRRSAGMLAELARLFPYPPRQTGMLTTTLREQAAELLREAALAEAAAEGALAAALAADARAALTRDLTVVDLDPARLPDLFACVAEIPIAGLDADAAACRDRLAPRLGPSFGGKLLYQSGRLVGHILWAPLDEALYPVAARGRRWFVFCPWLESSRRGRGLGALLFEAVESAARAAAVDGLLTLATSIEVFLHHRGYERHGFVEVDRRGDTRLLERLLSDAPSDARLLDPPVARPGGALPVVVRHAHNCPLLLRVRQGAAQAARELGPRAAVDERDATPADPSGVTVGGRALAHAPIPPAALREGFVVEADDWR
jgi:GNAT superfamily N-acetyltransferase